MEYREAPGKRLMSTDKSVFFALMVLALGGGAIFSVLIKPTLAHVQIDITNIEVKGEEILTLREDGSGIVHHTFRLINPQNVSISRIPLIFVNADLRMSPRNPKYEDSLNSDFHVVSKRVEGPYGVQMLEYRVEIPENKKLTLEPLALYEGTLSYEVEKGASKLNESWVVERKALYPISSYVVRVPKTIGIVPRQDLSIISFDFNPNFIYDEPDHRVFVWKRDETNGPFIAFKFKYTYATNWRSIILGLVGGAIGAISVLIFERFLIRLWHWLRRRIFGTVQKKKDVDRSEGVVCPDDVSIIKPKCDPQVVDSLWREHESLTTSIHQRGTGYLLANSILITGSLVLLGSILNTSGSIEGLGILKNLTVLIPLLLVLEFLIFAAWYWFESVKKIDKLTYERVHQIEKCLQACGFPVRGHLSLLDQLKGKPWYHIRSNIIWRALFLILMIVNIFVVYGIFSS